jgi:hypothetical protein
MRLSPPVSSCHHHVFDKPQTTLSAPWTITRLTIWDMMNITTTLLDHVKFVALI